MQIFAIDVRQRSQIQVPLVGIVNVEVEMGVLVFVRLLHHRVFEVVAFPKGAVTMVVVIHPLIDGRGLLADGLQRRVRVKQRKRGSQAIVGDAVHADFAVVVGNVFQQPLDRVISVGGLVGRLGIVEIDPGGQIELAFGLEAPS